MSNKVDKPWGWYRDLERNFFRVIKTIHISPNKKFSLQKHFHRDEFWYILSGSGKITLDSEVKEVTKGEHFFIPRETIHRLEGGPDGIDFLEVQEGECSEDDILRLEDDYGRN